MISSSAYFRAVLIIAIFCLQCMCSVVVASTSIGSETVASPVPALNNEQTYSAKYAYATIHYEGTPADDAYLIALRTMHASIKRSGTKYPFVVLVSPEVRQSTRETLTQDGAILKDVPNIPNPFSSHVKKHFTKTLNKIHLWNMLDYDRVVYLDADNILLENADELFQCGHFCAVYMNPINFHTGLLVLKPDRTVYSDMMANLLEPSSTSYDGADQGFLTQFFGYKKMQESPIFVPFSPSLTTNPNPSTSRYEHSLMRLPPWYNLNVFWFYEKGHWGHWRTPESGRFYEKSIPGLTLCWPVPPFLKPWFWVSHVFMDHLWDMWNEIRMSVHKPYDKTSFFTSLIFSVSVFILADLVLRCCANRHFKYSNLPIQKKKKNDVVVQKYPKSCGLHPALQTLFCLALPIVIGTFLCATFATSVLVSPITPPFLAWPLYSALYIIILSVFRYRRHKKTSTSIVHTFLMLIPDFIIHSIYVIISYTQFYPRMTVHFTKLGILCVWLNFLLGVRVIRFFSIYELKNVEKRKRCKSQSNIPLFSLEPEKNSKKTHHRSKSLTSRQVHV